MSSPFRLVALTSIHRATAIKASRKIADDKGD